MKKLRFFARGDAATGGKGSLNLIETGQQPTVELVFGGHVLHQAARVSHSDPTCDQTVLVDGVERFFWVECAGRLRPQRDLRSVRGHDLRQRMVRVITTDDTRRYAFIVEPDLPRYVTDAIPAGRRRLAARLRPLMPIKSTAVPAIGSMAPA